MKNIRDEAIVWVQVAAVAVIWIAVLYFTNTPLQINVEAVKKLPDVVTIYLIVYLVFTHWAWRLPIFTGWLVPFRDLTGTWEGKLTTTWKDPETGEAPPAIEVLLVIRHRFDSISCVLYTKESMSRSTAATLYGDGGDGIKTLSYTYMNEPKAAVRHRSAISNGAAVLRILERPDRRLEGQYWTDRRTAGDIALRFKTRHCQDRFD